MTSLRQHSDALVEALGADVEFSLAVRQRDKLRALSLIGRANGVIKSLRLAVEELRNLRCAF